MGGRVSRLEIQLDEEPGQTELIPLPAGSRLQGKLVAELSRPLEVPPPGIIDAKPAVQLRFYGKEKVRMNRHKSTKTYGTHGGSHAHKSAERSVLELSLQWREFPGTVADEEAQGAAVATVPAGTYVFPFSIQLPQTLPSSTYYPANDNRKRSRLSFRIQYKLTVALNYGTKTLRTATRYVWIKAAAPDPPPEPLPCMVKPVAHEIKGGLFGGKGTFLFGAAVDDCRVSNSVNMHLACRNDSSADVQRVQIKVQERLTWGTAAVNKVDPMTGSVTKSATLQQTETNILFILRDVQLPGLARERKGMLKSALHSIVGSQQEKLQRQVYDDLVSGENLIRVQLPEGARESYQGQLVQVSHFIMVEFHTDSGINSPVIEIPIDIVSIARPESSHQIQQPSGAGNAYQVAPPLAAKSSAGEAASATSGTLINAALVEGPTPVTTYVPEIVVGCEKNTHGKIPMVTARPIPDNAAEASTVSSADVVVLGGDAILRSESRRRMTSMTLLEDLVPLAPPTVVSLQGLLGEMRSSIDDFELISEKLQKDDWMQFFQKLSPDDFGRIIASIHVEFDQPRVAVLLSPHLKSGLSCDYIVVALQNTSDQHRAVMAQQLLPLCVDASEGHHLIRAELNEWELFQINDALDEAVRRGVVT